MRKSKRFSALALVAGLAITAAACGSDKKESSDTSAAATTAAGASTTAAASTGSTPAGGSVDGSKVLACEVTDTGGADDKGFNQSAYEGVTNAEKEYGIKGELLESKTDADYVPNINTFIGKECSVIITVGFLLGAATSDAALANPDRQFAIVDSDANDTKGTDDSADDTNLTNVRALLFATEQPSYLAGYLAAGVSKSGIVATYGGIKIPSVTSFMSGFLQGVNKYNEVHGTKVKVLGWDGNEGSFTGNFENLDDGKKLRWPARSVSAPRHTPRRTPARSASSAWTSTSTSRTRTRRRST
jgi:basic membrane protein A